MYKYYCLMLFLVIGTACSSLQYQQAKNRSEIPWGICKASGVLNGNIELFSLFEEDKKKRWLEGHSNFKLHNEPWKVEIRSDFHTNNHENFCSSSLTVRRNGLEYVKDFKEILPCKDSLTISSSVRVYLKSNDEWKNVKFDCKKY